MIAAKIVAALILLEIIVSVFDLRRVGRMRRLNKRAS